jgi:hypothetical protein
MMASRPISAEQMLAAIPSLPRPMLTRIVDQMIDRLDELDGDADQEADGAASPLDQQYVTSFPTRWRLSIRAPAGFLEVAGNNDL